MSKLNSVPKDVAAQRKYYTQTADEYDVHIDGDEEHNFSLAWLSGLIEYTGAKSLIDVGSGTGRALVALKARHPNLRVLGVEPVFALREKALKKGILGLTKNFTDFADLAIAEYDEADLSPQVREDEKGENFHTFTLITCQANDLVAITHERMPVILTPEGEQIWLAPQSTGPELISLLKPYEGARMDCYSVSPRINSSTANDATLIIPVPPADQFGNLTLFD